MQTFRKLPTMVPKTKRQIPVNQGFPIKVSSITLGCVNSLGQDLCGAKDGVQTTGETGGETPLYLLLGLNRGAAHAAGSRPRAAGRASDVCAQARARRDGFRG